MQYSDMEIREFPTLVVASALTGVAMCSTSYNEIKQCAGHLYGDDLWTHELAHQGITEAYRSEGYRQFPDMPSREEAQADYEASAVRAVQAYGDTISVRKGKSTRNAGPIETLSEMVKETDRG